MVWINNRIVYKPHTLAFFFLGSTRHVTTQKHLNSRKWQHPRDLRKGLNVLFFFKGLIALVAISLQSEYLAMLAWQESSQGMGVWQGWGDDGSG